MQRWPVLAGARRSSQRPRPKSYIYIIYDKNTIYSQQLRPYMQLLDCCARSTFYPMRRQGTRNVARARTPKHAVNLDILVGSLTTGPFLTAHRAYLSMQGISCKGYPHHPYQSLSFLTPPSSTASALSVWECLNISSQ